MKHRKSLFCCLALALWLASIDVERQVTSASTTPAITPTVAAQQRQTKKPSRRQPAERQGQGGAVSRYSLEAQAEIKKFFASYLVECGRGRFFLKVLDNARLPSGETIVEPHYLEGRDVSYHILPYPLVPAQVYNNILWTGSGGLRFTATRKCNYENPCPDYEPGTAGLGVFNPLTRLVADITIDMEKRVNQPWEIKLFHYQGIKPLTCAEVRAHPIWREPGAPPVRSVAPPTATPPPVAQPTSEQVTPACKPYDAPAAKRKDDGQRGLLLFRNNTTSPVLVMVYHPDGDGYSFVAYQIAAGSSRYLWEGRNRDPITLGNNWGLRVDTSCVRLVREVAKYETGARGSQFVVTSDSFR
jgi:hypothetical protein